VSNLTTSNGDINLKTAGLAINQPLNAGTGNVRLVESGLVSQAGLGIITAANLSVSDTTGNVVLELAHDVTGKLAVSLTSAGEAFSFNDSGNAGQLLVDTVLSASATVAGSDPLGLFPQIAGATANNGDINVKSNGLTINQAIAVGTGNVRLVDTAAVSQAAAAPITGGAASGGERGLRGRAGAPNKGGTVAGKSLGAFPIRGIASVGTVVS